MTLCIEIDRMQQPEIKEKEDTDCDLFLLF